MRRLSRSGWLAFLPVCLLAVSLAGCELESYAGRLGRDLTEAVGKRAKCRAYKEPRLWSCVVETDPGSGWSRGLHLRVDENGCWRARYVRFGRGSTARGSDLYFDGRGVAGRTFRGCTEIDD